MNRLLATTTVATLALLAGACNRQSPPAESGTPAAETPPAATPAPEAPPAAAPAPAAPGETAPPGAATTGAAQITLQQKPGLGSYLADADGRALYLFEADRKGESTCYDACAKAWLPLVATQGTPTVQGNEIDASKLGTLRRRDGSTQITYNGHPLYYFSKDTGPGSTAGQDVKGFGAEWYLVAPDGNKLEKGRS